MHLDTLPPLSPLVVLSPSFEWYPSSLWPPILERCRFLRFLCQDRRLQRWAYHLLRFLLNDQLAGLIFPSSKMAWAVSMGVPWRSAQVWFWVSLNGCGMVNREISGSGRINASIFVDGRSMMKDRSKSNTGSKLVLEIKWVACLMTSEGILGSVRCRVVIARWKSSMLTVLFGCGWSANGIPDAAFSRSLWRRPNLTARIHSAFDPSRRFMSMCPEGMDIENWNWSSPEVSGLLLLWCVGADLEVENAVSGLVAESWGELV